MKTFVLTLCLAISMISLSGCGESKPASMTEGVPLSDIEAYERDVQAMEAEDADSMEMDE